MIRSLIIIVVIAAAVGAAASPSARLAALVEDGLLIEDAGADGMWPASLAEHGAFGAFRTHGESDDMLGMSFEARRRLVGGVMLRLRGDAVPDADPETTAARERILIQAARAWSGFSFGAGVYRDGPLGDETPSGRGRRGAVFGFRLRPWSRHVLDGAVDVGETRWSRSASWAGSVDTWRLRYFGELSERVIMTAAYESAAVEYGYPDPDAAEDPVGSVTFENRTFEAGFLFWPDADSQIAVVWVERRRKDASRYDDRRVARDDRGFRFSAEVRPSAWFTFRSGFSYLDVASEVTTDSPGYDAVGDGDGDRLARIGLGGAIHLGDVDMNFTWSHGGPDLTSRYGSLPGRDGVFHGDFVVRF